MISRAYLVCDYVHRVLVAEQRGEHIDDQLSCHKYYCSNVTDGSNLVRD